MIDPTATTHIPIACSLTDPQLAARTAALERDIFAAALEHVEIADGYAFRFPQDEEWLPELAAFIVEERRCCPFFTFELVQAPASGPVWLRLRGPDGVKPFIESQFIAMPG